VSREDYTRVTSILEPYGPDFSQVRDIDFYADRGSRVHYVCSMIARGLFAPVDKDIRGYVDSFNRFFDTVDKVLLIEERLYSDKWMVSGQPDLVCTLKYDPRIIIPDYKSALAYHRVWDVQISGYKVLYEENYPGQEVKRWGSLRLRKDGSVPKFRDADPGGVLAFYGAVNIHHFMHKIAA